MQPPFSGAGGASQPVSKTSGPLDAGGQSLSAVPVPDLAASCPSVLEDVLRENLSGVASMAALCCSPPLLAAILKGCQLACHLKLNWWAAGTALCRQQRAVPISFSYCIGRCVQGRHVSGAAIPMDADSMCAMHADIIEMQAVDRDLFSFVLQLMKHNAEDVHRKLRRTEPSPSNSPVR